MPQQLAPGAVPLSVIADDARVLDVRAFAGTHGDAFFVVVSSPFPTVGTRPITRPGEEGKTGEIAIGVFGLRRQDESTHPFISIGRTDDNDVAIHDDTVSRFHAYLRRDREGRWLLQDARSKNGTTVDGASVARRGDGDPTPLTSGCLVMFGSVSVHFLDAEALQRMARETARRVA